PNYNVEKLSKGMATPIVDKKTPTLDKKPNDSKKPKTIHNPSLNQQTSDSMNNNPRKNK
ncbi:7286_t:CDS:1, partial [Acaulospora colombiana]